MVVEFVQGKPYTCPALTALTPSKGKEVAKQEKEVYLFDIVKVHRIFDCLVKDKHIKFSEGHKIPSTEEIKGRKYCN